MTDGAGPTTQAPLPAAVPEPAPTAASWYRRRAFLVTAGVVVIVGAAVISDLPTSTSRATDVQGETTVISEINADVAPCVFSVREALTLRADEVGGALSAGNRAQIPGLLRDDQDACSFTDASIFDLSNIEVPGSPAGRDMGQAVNTATLWATSDALEVIEQIQALTTDPTDAKAGRRLAAAERLLAQDATKTAAEVDAGGRTLHTTLPAIDLSTQDAASAGPGTTGS